MGLQRNLSIKNDPRLRTCKLPGKCWESVVVLQMDMMGLYNWRDYLINVICHCAWLRGWALGKIVTTQNGAWFSLHIPNSPGFCWSKPIFNKMLRPLHHQDLNQATKPRCQNPIFRSDHHIFGYLFTTIQLFPWGPSLNAERFHALCEPAVPRGGRVTMRHAGRRTDPHRPWWKRSHRPLPTSRDTHHG